MKQLVIFTQGLSHPLLPLISMYLETADTAFDVPPETAQLAAFRAAGRTPCVLSQNKKAPGLYHAANIARRLRSAKYDVVYVHGVNCHNMLPALVGARLAGIRQIVACAHSGGGRVGRLPRSCFRKATASDKALGLALFHGQEILLPEGVFPGCGLDESLRAAWRAAFGMTGQHIYLQISPFERAAQYDRTLDMFKEILVGDPDARLICVGQGPMRSEILARVEYENLSDFVSLPGDTDNITPFLMAADALWLPAGEQQAAVLLPAAQAVGLPCFLGEAIDCGAALIKEELYPLQAALKSTFSLPLEQRHRLSKRALQQAQRTGRTAEAIGRILMELATY